MSNSHCKETNYQVREKLPKGVIRKHSALYWISVDRVTKKQKWHRLGTNWTEASSLYRELVIKTRKSGYVERVLYGSDGGPIPVLFLKEMIANAKKNAKAKGIECALTLDEAKILAERSSGKCELTGIQFRYGEADEMRDSSGRRKRLWAASFDRMNPAVGYVASNLRIVCFAVNAARQEFGDVVLMKIAHALVAHANVGPR